MLHDVKLRIYDRARKLELHEIVTVDAAGGDDAAEAAQAIRPGAVVVGVGPPGGFAGRQDAVMEGDDNPPDDEDAEPGPSNREIAEMQVRRGPGRPRKNPLP